MNDEENLDIDLDGGLSATNEQELDNNPVHEAVLSYWGERCPDYHEECPVCQAWKEYDTLEAIKEEVRDYCMPKIKNIFTRLHGGTDDMRDEGHKLWLVYKDLHQLTKEKTNENQ